MLTSWENFAKIVFTSDFSVNKAGFNMTFVPIGGKFVLPTMLFSEKHLSVSGDYQCDKIKQQNGIHD